MTDLLSPILYVMEREDDAYICFAAMFERIKVNFTEWCEGTLNKLERLKHLCEVLDPELFSCLSQQNEDPFVLFFGMVLIECRREFSFQDSLHLLEVLWAAALHRDAPSLDDVSQAKWASFMTSVSTDIVLQTFGEVEAPYSTHPLDEDSIGLVTSLSSMSSINSSRRSTSTARNIPRPGSASVRSIGHSRAGSFLDDSSPTLVVSGCGDSPPKVSVKRSKSLPDNNYVVISSDCVHSNESRSEGDLCKGESEGSIVGELAPPTATPTVPKSTEMADMSSVSSAATSNGQRGVRNSTSSGKDLPTNSNNSSNRSSGSKKDDDIETESSVQPAENGGFLHGALEVDSDSDNCDQVLESDEGKDEMFNKGIGDRRRVQTLPRERTSSSTMKRENQSMGNNSSTLPRSHTS